MSPLGNPPSLLSSSPCSSLDFASVGRLETFVPDGSMPAYARRNFPRWNSAERSRLGPTDRSAVQVPCRESWKRWQDGNRPPHRGFGSMSRCALSQRPRALCRASPTDSMPWQKTTHNALCAVPSAQRRKRKQKNTSDGRGGAKRCTQFPRLVVSAGGQAAATVGQASVVGESRCRHGRRRRCAGRIDGMQASVWGRVVGTATATFRWDRGSGPMETVMGLAGLAREDDVDLARCRGEERTATRGRSMHQ